MKTNRTASQIDSKDKTIYPKCNLKKEHEKQTMNMICLTKTCKFAGPICTLCRKQHMSHNVVSIKNFLSSVGEAHKKQVIQNNRIEEKQQIQQLLQKTAIQRLQETFNQVMSVLKYQVQELTQQIRRTENNLIYEFKQAKAQLQEQSKKGQLLEQSLAFFTNRQFLDALQFRKNVNSILKNLIVTKDDVKVPSKEEEIIKGYESKALLYKDNLFLIQQQIKELYSSIHDKFLSQKVQKVIDLSRPKTAIVSSLKSENFIFSPHFKAANIVLEKEGKSAKLKETNGNKVAFFHNNSLSKIHQTTIKISNLTGVIVVGVGLKDKLKAKGLKFEKNPGHGLYVIASNNMKFNHSEKNQDMIPNSFTFGTGDEITISFKAKQKKILFTVKNDDKRKTELSLKSLPDASLKELQFCVGLSVIGDKVQIM